MNKWRITFIFLAGFWLHELLAHIWLTAEGMLPITSKFWPWPITADMNIVFIVVNLAIFLVLAYFAFLYQWDQKTAAEMQPAPR